MRPAIFCILLILAIALAVCVRYTRHSEKSIAPALRTLLISLLPPVLGNALIILARSRVPALLGSYAYITGLDFVMAALMGFTLEYCQLRWRRPWHKRLFYTVLVVDVAQILLNPFLGHAFVIEEVVAYGAPYFRFLPLLWLSVHRLLCYLIFFVVLLIFLLKSLRVSRVYAERYFIILAVMLLTGLWETFYVFSRAPIDRSMVGYGVFGLLVYYLALYYRPMRLLDQMLADVASGLPEALFFFTDDKSCVWTNAQGQRFLGNDRNALEHCEARLRAFCPELQLEGEWSRTLHSGAAWKAVGSLLSIRDNTEQEEELQRQRYQATHDNLTDVYTREHLFLRIRETLDENPEKTYVVSYLDINDFKLINDIYGRDFGDFTLKTLADALRATMPPEAIYGRLTGDCFGLCMEQSAFDAVQAEQYLHGFTVKSEGAARTLLIHQGVYVVTEPEIDVSLMFDRAHMALETIKNEYKKHLAFYNDTMRQSTLWDQQISDQLQGAIAARQLRPYLQAIVDADGRVVGAEVLVRWLHPVHGFLAPIRFIPTLERNGMIADLDRYMWRCACEILARWRAQGDEEHFLSVNISPKDFYFMDVPAELSGIVREYGVPASRLRVEITETVMMADSLKRITTLQSLKDEGFLVEMDDFGSGYSSLNMLKDMPVDVIKIDMAFLTRTEDSWRAHLILRNVMNMSGDLGIDSLTEGVETEEQYSLLREMGCMLFQGYHFAKPLPLEEFEAKFLSKC